jgi:hypothetical protein
MKIKNSTLAKKLPLTSLFRMVIMFMMVYSINVASAQIDTIQINFGASTAIAGWNSLVNFGQAIEPTILNNTKGEATPVGLQVTGTFVANNTAGTTEPDQGIGFPGSVTVSNWYASRTSFASFTLSGLDPAKDYLFLVFGSILREDGNVREAQYNFFGADTLVLLNDATLNTSVVALGTAKPTSEGLIVVDIITGPNNTNGGGNFHMSAMKIIYAADSGTGFGSDTKANRINVFPNPAKDNVNIQVSEMSRVRIHDITGRMVFEQLVQVGDNRFDLKLNAGLYMVQIIGTDKKVYTTKLVIE